MAGKKHTEEQVARFADMFSTLGTEPRLRIMRLLLSAHPEGMVVATLSTNLRLPPPRSRTIWTSSKMRNW